MSFDTDKVDIWVYIVVFIFVVIPFAWGKIKVAKASIREMLDISKIDNRLDKIENKLDSFIELEKRLMEFMEQERNNK